VNYRHRYRVTPADLDRLLDDLGSGALAGEVPPHGTLGRVRQQIPADRAAGVVTPEQVAAPVWFASKEQG
jgi:NADH-quinone oxidoreductase subunit E